VIGGNPCGKLPVEVPRHPGAQPHTYLAPVLEIPTTGSIEVTATVSNTGDGEGVEVVQLYATDPARSEANG
jgi:beta-xylosidase